MSSAQPRPDDGAQDAIPIGAPQTTPKGVGYGHPEYNFIVGLMELKGSMARMETILESVKQATDDTKGKVARLEKIAYAAGVIAVICIAIGSWMLTTAKDFAMTYYKASLEAQAKTNVPPPAGIKPKP